MDKKEILEKSRNSDDEMEIYAKYKAMLWTYLTAIAISAVFAFIRAEQNLSMADFTAVVSASAMAGLIYRFIKTKKKFNLISAVIMLMIFVLSVYRFYLGY